MPREEEGQLLGQARAPAPWDLASLWVILPPGKHKSHPFLLG